MTKRRIRLPDGRYMIFYTFEEPATSADPGASPPRAELERGGESGSRVQPATPEGTGADE